ncbi:MAG: hypothetical protein WBB24_03225 [Maribacter sp.]
MMVQVVAAIAIIIALGFMISLIFDRIDFKSKNSDEAPTNSMEDEDGFCEISLENMMEANSSFGNKDFESLRSKIESINNRNKFYKM